MSARASTPSIELHRDLISERMCGQRAASRSDRCEPSGCRMPDSEVLFHLALTFELIDAPARGPERASL